MTTYEYTYHWAQLGSTNHPVFVLMAVKPDEPYNKNMGKVAYQDLRWNAYVSDSAYGTDTDSRVEHFIGVFDECVDAQGAVMAELVADRLQGRTTHSRKRKQ